MAIHPFPQARLPVRRDQTRIKKLRHQIVQVMIRLQNHIPARAPVAPARPAFGTEDLPQKRHASLAAMTRPPINFDLVNEHDCPSKTKKARLINLAVNYTEPA
jgi:hypothetical protein